MAITTLLFDFGGVIYTSLDPTATEKRRNVLAVRIGFQDAHEMWQRFYKGKEWFATKTGLMTDAEMWRALLSPLGLTTSEKREEFLKRLFEGEGLHTHMRQLLLLLHERYRLAILSNASDALEEILEKQLKVIELFEFVANSHRLGVAKPDRRAFETTLEFLGVLPEQVLFIDDQEKNTTASKALGIHSHLFVDLPSLQRHLIGKGLLSG